MPARYKEIGRVANDLTKLVRQDRLNLEPCHRMLSWRQARPNNTNRKFYIEGNFSWSITVDVALDLMSRASNAGYLCAESHDPGEIAQSIIIEPGNAAYHDLIRMVLVADVLDETWINSSVVLCVQRNPSWRKAMLISPGNNVTFRSFTNDINYKAAYRKYVSGDGWWLDQSMLDAHPTAFNLWLSYLEQRGS